MRDTFQDSQIDSLNKSFTKCTTDIATLQGTDANLNSDLQDKFNLLDTKITVNT